MEPALAATVRSDGVLEAITPAVARAGLVYVGLGEPGEATAGSEAAFVYLPPMSVSGVTNGTRRRGAAWRL